MTQTKKVKFFCEADNGLEIRGHKVYGQTNVGGYWHDDGLGSLGTVPMSAAEAQRLISWHLQYADAPTQAEALSALTGSKH